MIETKVAHTMQEPLQAYSWQIDSFTHAAFIAMQQAPAYNNAYIMTAYPNSGGSA